MIAGDGTLVSQSKTADYYQSSCVIARRELDLKKSRLYVFNQFVSQVKTPFLIPLKYLELRQIYDFQVRVFLKWITLLHQNINSFLRQFVFIHEIITSNNFYKSLYSA
jgi:hypothetical protein